MNHTTTYFSACYSIRMIVLYSLSMIALTPVLGMFIWPQDIFTLQICLITGYNPTCCIDTASLQKSTFLSIENKVFMYVHNYYFLPVGLTDCHKALVMLKYVGVQGSINYTKQVTALDLQNYCSKNNFPIVPSSILHFFLLLMNA